MSTSNPHISEPIQSVIPDMAVGSPNQTHSVLQPQRPLDPRSSVEDYNRVMRDYTQRRMSTFADKEDYNFSERGMSTSSRQSRSSESSGDSGRNRRDSPSNTTSGLMARQQQQFQGGKAAGSGAEQQAMQNSMGF